MAPRREARATRSGLPPIDREKLRAALRRIGDEHVYYMLDDAIEALPPAKLAQIVGQYIQLERLRPDDADVTRKRTLLEDVRAFDAASRRGEYYVSFNVNSKNCMETSTGTRAFIADCRRLLDRCVAESAKDNLASTREAFDTLFALLRYIDEGHDDVVFFADEGGSWQVGVDSRKMFPAWFRCVARTAEPADFAQAVVETVDGLEYHDRDRLFAAARRLGSAAQRGALDARIAATVRRR
jgi:hypothetical protein